MREFAQGSPLTPYLVMGLLYAIMAVILATFISAIKWIIVRLPFYRQPYRRKVKAQHYPAKIDSQTD